MDSPEKMESGPSFRKTPSDKAGRTYRRHSSPSDESPKHERNKNHDSSKSEREIEKTNYHNRSERDYDRHSDDYSKRYDDNYDYKSRNKGYREKEYRKEETRDRERKDRYNREYNNREKERKDYHERENERKDYRERENERKDYHEREYEKRKRSENSSSLSHEVKQRESKFSKPEEKEKAGSSVPAGTDLNAAKAAAMKAADSVNKNIGGPVGGSLTTEQKKKMLWGNKKKESTQDITKNWDLNLFADRERQEKFNKLMGVKGQNSGQETETKETEKMEKLETDLEKQYTAGLRRRDGRTVGLGL